MNNLINPFELLGVNINSSISELKKNYYNLSLLVHPDKGGNDKDFQIIYSAYNYIKKQLINKENKETTYEKLEGEFEEFLKEQTEVYTPFYEIYKETNDWLNEFNKEFENNKEKKDINNNIFEKGYGDFMETNPIKNIEYDNIEKNIPKKIFKNELIKYEKPNYLPNNIINYPLDIKEIKDFSNLETPLKMTDYKLSLSNDLNEKDLLKFNNKEFKDYPKNNLEYN